VEVAQEDAGRVADVLGHRGARGIGVLAHERIETIEGACKIMGWPEIPRD
jgi:hypothetical protein